MNAESAYECAICRELFEDFAESRPSSATHSAPSGAAFVSANSAAPFPVRE